MPLDMSKILPGTDAMMARKRKRRNRLRLFVLLACLAGLAYYVYPRYGGRIADRVGALYTSVRDEVAETAGPAPDTEENPLPSEARKLPSATADTPRASVVPPDSSAEGGADENSGNGSSPKNADRHPREANKDLPQKAVDGIAKSWARVIELEKSGDIDALVPLLEEIAREHPRDEHGAMAIYRLALISWKAGKKHEAEQAWKRAYANLPETQGGRMSALALGDLWYSHFAGARPQYDKWEAIRDAYSCAMDRDRASFLGEAVRKRTVERLNRLNQYVVFSRAPCRGSEFHIVGKSDRLSTIARKYEVHFDSIATINGIKPPHYFVREGEKLKILKLPASILVDKKRLILTLYLGGKWVKQYPVCVGPGEKTPLGTFTIATKSPKPDWTDPDTGKQYKYGHAKNILGTRWLGFNRDGPGRGIGIHGTTLPHSIPGRTSNGCIRMRNEDVEELYGFALIGSPITIIE